MDDLSALRERLRTQRPVAWEQLPDFSLYMDQVLSYMDRQILRFDGDDTLTAAMVNNYTKSGLVPRADGKKYSREHLVYLTAICILKRVMSAKDMSVVLSAELQCEDSITEFYEQFRESLDKDLNLITDMMEAYGEDDAVEAALHFALLSYAAGLASNRYVSLLRERAETAAAAQNPKEKSDKPSGGKKPKETGLK